MAIQPNFTDSGPRMKEIALTEGLSGLCSLRSRNLTGLPFSVQRSENETHSVVDSVLMSITRMLNYSPPHRAPAGRGGEATPESTPPRIGREEE